MIKGNYFRVLFAVLAPVLGLTSGCKDSGSGSNRETSQPCCDRAEVQVSAPSELVFLDSLAFQAAVQQSAVIEYRASQIEIEQSFVSKSLEIPGYEYRLADQDTNSLDYHRYLQVYAKGIAEPLQSLDLSPEYYPYAPPEGLISNTENDVLSIVERGKKGACPAARDMTALQCKPQPENMFPNESILFNWWSLQNPELPVLEDYTEIEGQYLGGIQLGEDFLLVSYYKPVLIAGYSWSFDSEERKLGALLKAKPEQYTPMIRRPDLTRQYLNEGCYIVGDEADFQLGDMLNLSLIDLSAKTLKSNICLRADVDQVSLTQPGDSSVEVAVQLADGSIHRFVINTP